MTLGGARKLLDLVPRRGRVRQPIIVGLLTILTLGVYGWVWWYRAFKELEPETGEAHHKSLFVAAVVAMPFLPLGALVSAAYGWTEMETLHRAYLKRDQRPGLSEGAHYPLVGAVAGIVVGLVTPAILIGGGITYEALTGARSEPDLTTLTLTLAGILVFTVGTLALVQQEFNNYWRQSATPASPPSALDQRSSVSWAAYKAAWRVIRHDPELLWAPLLGILLLACFLSLGVGAWILGLRLVESLGISDLALFVLALPLAWAWMSTVVLVEAFVVVTAHERIHGGSPSLRRSLARVAARAHKLLGWAFLAAFIYSTLSLFGRRVRGADVAGGVAVAVATMFVVPRIVLEQGTVLGSVRESAQAVGEQFGPVAKRTVTFAVYAFVPFLILFAGGPMVAGSLLGGVADAMGSVPLWASLLVFVPWVLAFLWLLLNGIAWSVYATALFDSLRGRRAGWFPPQALLSPFR